MSVYAFLNRESLRGKVGHESETENMTSYLHFSQNLTIRLAISDCFPNCMHILNILSEGIVIL